MLRDRLQDPRYYQIAVLSALLLFGVLWLSFPVGGKEMAALLASCLLAQLAWTKALRLPHFDPRSALISGLSLCLLMRSGSWPTLVAAAVVTISSKYVFRLREKHIFNPTNFGLVSMMALTDQVWVSPGQWGSTAVLGLFLASAGALVVRRAERSDITVTVLVSYCALVFGRACWLGDPWRLPWHQLQSGALLIFAFFMISDPKSTPNSRLGRILFGALVVATAGWIQFGLYRPNGFLWSLALLSPLVPLIDRLLPGRRYLWNSSPTAIDGGRPHAPSNAPRPFPCPLSGPAAQRS